jgi:hypothetical protein
MEDEELEDVEALPTRLCPWRSSYLVEVHRLSCQALLFG